MWSVMMRGRDENQRARLISELYLPLPGQDIEPDDLQVGPWSDEEMEASFTAMQTKLGGRAR
jgi:hypothetical protein